MAENANTKDFFVQHDQVADVKLALMSAWRGGCSDAAAGFGRNADGSGNYRFTSDALAANRASDFEVDGVTADWMSSEMAEDIVKNYPSHVDDVIRNRNGAARNYVANYVTALTKHEAMDMMRANYEHFHENVAQGFKSFKNDHGSIEPVPQPERSEELDMRIPLMEGTLEKNKAEIAEFDKELKHTGVRYAFSELVTAIGDAGQARVQSCVDFMSRDFDKVRAACETAASKIAQKGKSFADKVRNVPLAFGAAAMGIKNAAKRTVNKTKVAIGGAMCDAADLMDAGYERMMVSAGVKNPSPMDVAAKAKHSAASTANISTSDLPRAQVGKHSA